MKKFTKIALTALCTGAVALSLAGCQNAGKSTRLGAPAKAEEFDYFESKDEGYISIKKKANNFAYGLSDAAYSVYDSAENFSVASVSVYCALALAAECAGGETRAELLNALGTDYNELSTNFSKLFRSLDGEAVSHYGDLESALKLTNSIWINDGVQYNKPCITNLSEKYFAYSYSADFVRDNANANKAVRAFVKENTRGLIDRDFQLSDETFFTLINTLYLKDIWNNGGSELGFTNDEYTFTEHDGNAERLKLLSGYYNLGRAMEYKGFTSFFTRTFNGYKIKFIVPDEGRTVNEFFTEENLSKVNGETEFGYLDEENKVRYRTRCLFPEFKTSYDKDLSEVLKENFGVKKLFERQSCDFSALTEEEVWCKKVQHVNTLTVNKKGIEGAAVTILEMAGASGPDEYTDVYEDFVVNRAFGFILTDYNDTVLFTGVVNEV